MTPTTTPSLTSHLLNHAHTSPSTSANLRHATTHPFLSAAGRTAAGRSSAEQASLPKQTLEAWLHQDIHYTRAYIRFIGGILTRLPLGMRVYTSTSTLTTANTEMGSDKTPTEDLTLPFRILDLLVFALNNLQREVRFFEAVCADCDLALPALEHEAEETVPKTVFTRAYTDLLDAVGAKAGVTGGGLSGVLEALVMLWGTEWCYLNAWRFARGEMIKAERGQGAGETWETAASKGEGKGEVEEGYRKALREHFIPNWSSDEFARFVKRCAGLVDEVAEAEGLGEILKGGGENGGGVDGGDGGDGAGAEGGMRARRVLKAVEEVFGQVMWVEQGFWPDV